MLWKCEHCNKYICTCNKFSIFFDIVGLLSYSSNIVEMLLKHIKYIIISPNEVFGDIMVLASPPPRPLVDPDVVYALTQKLFNGQFYMRVDTPLRYIAIEI